MEHFGGFGEKMAEFQFLTTAAAMVNLTGEISIVSVVKN